MVQSGSVVRSVSITAELRAKYRALWRTVRFISSQIDPAGKPNAIFTVLSMSSFGPQL